jgi:hypothetical protein
MFRILHRFDGRRELEALRRSLPSVLAANHGVAALHLEPGDATRYVVSLVRTDDMLLVGVQCPPSFAADIDPCYMVEPDGLADLAGRAPPLNPVTAALVCDLCNWACGFSGSDFYADRVGPPR